MLACLLALPCSGFIHIAFLSPDKPPNVVGFVYDLVTIPDITRCNTQIPAVHKNNCQLKPYYITCTMRNRRVQLLLKQFNSYSFIHSLFMMSFLY